MRRINFHHIKDISALSTLLDQILVLLANSELRITLKSLAYDTEISERTFEILRNLNETPELMQEFSPLDIHVVLSSVLFRFPTLKIWEEENKTFFLEI
jgi:hypothetical protein